MSKKGIAKHKRKEAFRDYRTKYLIITEGETEENYFSMIKRLKNDNIEIICKKAKHTSVGYLITKMNETIEREKPNKYARTWIVLDGDALRARDISDLQDWQNSAPKKVIKEIGVSSPEFEYWLLLHFELPSTHHTANSCLSRLKRYIPYYEKPFENCKILADKLETACENGRQKQVFLGSSDNGSNLHLLVEKLT